MSAIFSEQYQILLSLMERGGPMMWALRLVIFGFSMLAVMSILYVRRSFPAERDSLVAYWYSRPERSSWHASVIRRAALSEAQERLTRGFGVMKGLVAVCPLIGLLGTVLGMMDVFAVMTATGNNDARAIASGVSQATITTMGGMVGALLGLFMMSTARQFADTAFKKLDAALVMDDHLSAKPGVTKDRQTLAPQGPRDLPEGAVLQPV